jgi:serine protease Do
VTLAVTIVTIAKMLTNQPNGVHPRRWPSIFGLTACCLGALLTVAPAWSQPSPAPAKAQAGEGANQKQKAAGTRPAEPPAVLQQLNSALEELSARISPAVVQIVVTGYGPVESRNRSDTALIARQHAVGSGVIVDSEGYIMTNAHVVEGAQRIHVALPVPATDSPSQFVGAAAGRMVEAKLIGVHQESDLALLKIDKGSLPTLVLGATRPVHQGELVFALGSPEGLQNSVTMGVVSSVARQADPTRPLLYIQTDAPINPGNSGGPLVDAEGYVVGLNTFILSQGGGSEGLGFAIPARVVDFVYHSLRKYGHVHRVEVKAGAQTITPILAEGLGLAQDWGVIVDDVTPGGPADSAGLKVRDIILTADDRPINALPAFTASLYLHPLDQVLKLEVLRGTEKLTLNVPVLEMTEPLDALTSLANSQNNLVGRLGILALDLSDQLRTMVGDLRIPSGVVVVGRAAEFNSADSGLAAGDVIHSVNRTPIDSVTALRTAVRALRPGDAVVLQIERGGGLLYLAFDME